MRVVGVLVGIVMLVVGYFWVVPSWNYSTGERAGWVQKLSRKGWLCKTWEGELAMVSMPGAAPEKFYFTVWDDAVAGELNKVMGQRVSLHYEEKVGLPTSCFGETRHYVTRVTAVEELPLAPGVVVPTPHTASHAVVIAVMFSVTFRSFNRLPPLRHGHHFPNEGDRDCVTRLRPIADGEHLIVDAKFALACPTF